MPDAGSSSALQVVLNANSKEDYCSSAYTTGFKMRIHEPHVHPLVNSFSQLVPLSHESQVIIEQFLLSGMKSIRKVPLKDRKCFFHDENPLDFYRSVLRFPSFFFVISSTTYVISKLILFLYLQLLFFRELYNRMYDTTCT